MKATYNGITMEGTPKEIAELKQLLDDQRKQQLNYKIPYNPYTPYIYTGTPIKWYGGNSVTATGDYTTWNGITKNVTFNTI